MVGVHIGLLDLLEMLHNHVRHSIIAWYFTYGQMPSTWAEIQAAQQQEQAQ